MEKLKEKLITTVALATISISFGATLSHAVPESRPDQASLVNRTASDFFALIRTMEASGGPLGLNATIDDAGNETSDSNNIDAHMIKNTEYGTVAMLAASVYGAKNSTGVGSTVATTTNNATGVYQMGTSKNGDKYEYVAGILGTSTSANIKNIKNAPSKYWNNYTTERSSYKPGDGMKPEISWAPNDYWVSSSYPVFGRLSSSGVFSYSSGSGNADGYNSSRAVVVCGAGL